jgi:hypothetical protein
MLDHTIIQYAFNEKGERVSIYDVPNGRNSGCKCRICGEPLWARNKGKSIDSVLGPNQKVAHFYHPPESNCQGETLIHIMAKEVFKKTKKLLFDITINNHRDEYLRTERKFIEFDDVILEKNVDIKTNKWIRPDAKAIIDNKCVYVEFAYSSYIDFEKEDLIKSKKLNVIEIELNVPYIDWNDYQNEIKLENKITELLHEKSIASSNWINNYDLNSMFIEVIDTSEEEMKEKLKEEKKRIERKNQRQLMEVKKEILNEILGLGSVRRVFPVLSFEGETHYFSDKHFLIENDEVSILKESCDELIKLKESYWRDWRRIEESQFDGLEGFDF